MSITEENRAYSELVAAGTRAALGCGRLLVSSVVAERAKVAARLRGVAMDLKFAQAVGSAAVDGPIVELEAMALELEQQP